MESLRRPTATGREAATLLVTGPSLALTEARTAGVQLFERAPAMHGVLLARCRVAIAGRVIESPRALAIPAGVRHHVREMTGDHGCVAYFDARRYRFEDVVRLAERWEGFVPGHDDLREAYGDAISIPRRRVAPRLLWALEVLEVDGATVDAAAARVGLSASRLAHLVTDTLGPSPLAFRTWFKLRRALGAVFFGAADLTTAAHAAGFADSAHLTRTCKHLMGVTPAKMLPPVIHVSTEDCRLLVRRAVGHQLLLHGLAKRARSARDRARAGARAHGRTEPPRGRRRGAGAPDAGMAR